MKNELYDIDLNSPLAAKILRSAARGKVAFPFAELEEEHGVTLGAFLGAAERLLGQNRLISPKRGFYVAVPENYMDWGAPPVEWYLDDLMRHMRVPYYVGLLRAGAYHGATHHAVFRHQVVTSARTSDFMSGGVPVDFYFRKDVDMLSDGIIKRKTRSGTMRVSSVELTVLDLFRFRKGTGGQEHHGTVLNDLGGQVDPELLAHLSGLVERSAVQRAGHMMDLLGFAGQASLMHEVLQKRGKSAWIEMYPEELRMPPGFVREPIVRDPKWKVVVRRENDFEE